MKDTCLNDKTGACLLCKNCANEDGNYPDCEVECVECSENAFTCKYFIPSVSLTVVRCTKCNTNYPQSDLIPLTDPDTGKDDKCCPTCHTDVYLVY